MPIDIRDKHIKTNIVPNGIQKLYDHLTDQEDDIKFTSATLYDGLINLDKNKFIEYIVVDDDGNVLVSFIQDTDQEYFIPGLRTVIMDFIKSKLSGIPDDLINSMIYNKIVDITEMAANKSTDIYIIAGKIKHKIALQKLFSNIGLEALGNLLDNTVNNNYVYIINNK
jgi:hypothetical protein